MKNKVKVLILDDEQIVGERLQASLERDGYAVDVSFAGRDALDQLDRNNYDLLITDLKMSGTDGLQVLRAAKQAQPAIRVIVITGFATKDTAEEVLRSGAAEFIAKPFKISQLKSLLKKLSGLPEDTSR